MDNMSLADIAAVTRNNEGFGDGNGWWIILILLFALGGNGFGYGRGVDARCATVEDVNNSANFTRLENQVRFNENALQSGFMNTFNGICDSTFALNNAITTEGRALQTQLSQCCCDNKMLSLENRYLAAQNTAEINANTTAQTQKILDKLCQNEIDALRSKVSALELQAAMFGTVKYPTTFSYSAGNSPFCGSPCACGNI